MADGLFARLRSALSPVPVAPAGVPPGSGGPLNPTMEGAIPSNWPWNWWQRGMQPGVGGESATVNACVNAYAQTIAQLPGAHYREKPSGQPEKITTSALSRILRNPNGYQTRSDFMTNAVCDIMFSGNAYALAERNARQEISALHLTPAKSTIPYVEPESRAIFYALGANPLAGQIDYLVPERDVLHLRGRCRPGEPLRGVSPLTWALSAQAANLAISSTQASFYSNASQPSGVLSAEGPLSKEQMERLRAAWREHSAGVAAGEVPILGGGLKWVPMGMSAQDAQLVEAFRMSVADIARAFGVPLPIIGDMSSATFNNTEQLIALWLSTGLGYWVEAIEIAFDRFFGLPIDQYTELDTDALLRTAFKDRIDGLTKGIVGGLYSPNEARRKEGLGDVKFGDEPRVQAQVVPLSQVGKQPSAPAAPSAPTAGNPGQPPAPAPGNDNAPASPPGGPASSADPAAKAMGEMWEAAFTAFEQRLEAFATRQLPAPPAPEAPPDPVPEPPAAISLAGIETRQDWRRRELVFEFRLSDGSVQESRARMLPGILPADHAALGWGVITGDIIRDGEFDRVALCDDPQPGRPDHWSVREIRGRRGRAGPPGAAPPTAADSPAQPLVAPAAPLPPDDVLELTSEAEAGEDGAIDEGGQD
jgi:HK97 family phage portal protein